MTGPNQLKREIETQSPPATDILEFTRSVIGDYSSNDLWRVMQHLQVRRAFADLQPERMLVALIRQIAIVIGKTYAERGEDAQLADDLALMLIRDLLLDLDTEIIERHRNRKLPSRRAVAWKEENRR